MFAAVLYMARCRAAFRRALFIVAALFSLSACTSTPPANLGMQADGKLASCPDSPNCVSSFASQSDTTHYIPPIKVSAGGWSMLQKVVAAKPRFRIARKTEDYLHVEATTRILHFVDDLEFLYQPSKMLVQLRSASRVGYSDFGKNRSRIEKLRAELKARGGLR